MRRWDDGESWGMTIATGIAALFWFILLTVTAILGAM